MEKILDYLSSELLSELLKEANDVKNIFKKECEIWVKRKLDCKLIILGEAPLTKKQFFYNEKTGNYLSFLKQFYQQAKDFKDNDFREFLRSTGILNLDLYQFPLPTKFYDNDKKNVLFDEEYINNQISSLFKMGIITPSTNFVYRYKKLIDRGLYASLEFPIGFNGKHIINEPIAVQANAAIINWKLKECLPKITE